METFYVDRSLGDDIACNGMHWRPGGAGAGSGPFRTIARACDAIIALVPDQAGSPIYIRSHDDNGNPLVYTEEHGTSSSLGQIMPGDMMMGYSNGVYGYRTTPGDRAGSPILDASAEGLDYGLRSAGVDVYNYSCNEMWNLDIRGTGSYPLDWGSAYGLTVDECRFANCGGGPFVAQGGVFQRCVFENLSGWVKAGEGGWVGHCRFKSCLLSLITTNAASLIFSDHRGTVAISLHYGAAYHCTIDARGWQRSDRETYGIGYGGTAHSCVIRGFYYAFENTITAYGCVADCTYFGGTDANRYNTLGPITFADATNHDLRIVPGSLGSTLNPGGWDVVAPGACGTLARMPVPIDLGLRGRRS